ncbi:MAG: response regulator transcription factor [Bacteroidales bacterium]|nr:response regulator transcription factor [Bacteroidales bacterium]
MISVMIADDHVLVAEGLAKLINESCDAQVVAMASTLSETAEMLPQVKPQVLLLDVALPDGDGIDAIQQLRVQQPDLRIIVLTMFAEASVIHRAMQNGANGYLFKSAGVEEVRNAILTVEAGETYLSAEAQQMLSHEKQTPANLTMREREILGLIAEGCTMKDIADRLCLGFETVHSYTKNLRQKLGCNNTASLVCKAIKQHLI